MQLQPNLGVLKALWIFLNFLISTKGESYNFLKINLWGKTWRFSDSSQAHTECKNRIIINILNNEKPAVFRVKFHILKRDMPCRWGNFTRRERSVTALLIHNHNIGVLSRLIIHVLLQISLLQPSFYFSFSNRINFPHCADWSGFNQLPHQKSLKTWEISNKCAIKKTCANFLLNLPTSWSNSLLFT